jgi:autotransporter-associated beta strand protein
MMLRLLAGRNVSEMLQSTRSGPVGPLSYLLTHRKMRRNFFRPLAGVILSAAVLPVAWSQISVTDGTYSTDFDGLISTGTQTISATVGTQAELDSLDGWYGTKAGGTGSTAMVLRADNGGSNSGALYSYGATGSNDRALGSLASGSNVPAFGGWFTNDSGSLFTSISISFTSEFWRSSTVNQNFLSFSYGFDTAGITASSFLTSSAMIAVSELNVEGPDPVPDPPSNGALDGNSPANQESMTFTITGIEWFAGASLFIRWTDVNETGNDAGLAIDNFTLSATGGAESTALFWTAGAWNETSSDGGAGTWGNSLGGWDPGKSANFGGEGALVGLAGTVNANNGINFLEDGYTLEGGILEFGGSGQVTVFPGVTATIASEIAGTSGLTKVGSGLLILSGLNSFEGTVAINSGMLQIEVDGSLGAESNEIVLAGGGLKVVDDLEINFNRAVTGAGSLDVADGKILRFGGAVDASLNLLNTGTVTLGNISTLSGLTFSAAGTLNTEMGAYLTGNVTTTHTDGTARMLGYYALEGTTRVFTVADGSSDVDLEISATLEGTGYFHKLGMGTVYVSGDSTASYGGGFRIGSAGTANGGRLFLAAGANLGSSQLQANWGTLEAESDIVTSVGISMGGRESNRMIFTGGDMTFNGDSSLWESNGIQNRLDVYNTTTLNGTFQQNLTPSFVGTGLTIGGTGTFILNGDGSGQTRTTTVTDSATFVVNSIYGAAVTVDENATLKGTGAIAGLIEVSGLHAVGNSTGIQTAQGGVSYLSGAQFEWELAANSSATPGVDFDQLVVEGGNISIETGVTMELVFGSEVDWSDAFWTSNQTWTIIDNQGSGVLTGTFGLNSPFAWIDREGEVLSDAIEGAYFGLSYSDGDVILNYYAIPEPGTLGGIGLAGLLLVIRRRHRAAVR